MASCSCVSTACRGTAPQFSVYLQGLAAPHSRGKQVKKVTILQHPFVPPPRPSFTRDLTGHTTNTAFPSDEPSFVLRCG